MRRPTLSDRFRAALMWCVVACAVAQPFVDSYAPLVLGLALAALVLLARTPPSEDTDR